MAIYTNNAEGGTNGTGVTTANSDDNNAGSVLQLSTGGTRNYSSTWANSGTTSWFVDGATTVTPILGWDAIGTSKNAAIRIYFRFTALPPSTCAFMQARSSLGNHCGEFQVQANGKIRVAEAGGAQSTVGTYTLLTNTTYRFEASLAVGTTTSNGRLKYDLYVGDSTTAVESFDSGTTWNLNTGNVAGVRWGKLTSSPAWSLYFDDAAWNDGSTTYFGPYQGTPVLTFTGQNILELTTTGSNGTITLTQTSGTTATITGPVGEVWRIIRPAVHHDLLKFDLTATSDGSSVTSQLVIPPNNLSNDLVYLGGGASTLSNWK